MAMVMFIVVKVKAYSHSNRSNRNIHRSTLISSCINIYISRSLLLYVLSLFFLFSSLINHQSFQSLSRFLSLFIFIFNFKSLVALYILACILFHIYPLYLLLAYLLLLHIGIILVIFSAITLCDLYIQSQRGLSQKVRSILSKVCFDIFEYWLNFQSITSSLSALHKPIVIIRSFINLCCLR